MELAKLIVSLRLSDNSVAILQAGPALEAWEMVTEVMSPSDDIAKIMTYLGKRVLAYRVGQQDWRSLDSFDALARDPAEPSPTMY